MLGARTSARPKLVEPSGFASAARADLALAIAARRAADDALRQLEGAGAALREAEYAARTAVRDAEAAVEHAKGAASDFLIANATGAAGEAPITIKAARAALVEAQDGLEAATAAKDRLVVREAEAQRDATSAADRVRKAAHAVLFESPVAAKLADEVARLQADLVDKGAALLWLIRAGAWPTVQDIGHQHGKPADQRLRDVQSRMYQPPSYWADLVAAMPGQRVWDQALAALMQDANAPVPEVR